MGGTLDIKRPASLLTGHIDSTKARVIGNFNRFLESETQYSKHAAKYKRPPIFDVGKAKIK
jgi:hypothetical protein